MSTPGTFSIVAMPCSARSQGNAEQGNRARTRSHVLAALASAKSNLCTIPEGEVLQLDDPASQHPRIDRAEDYRATNASSASTYVDTSKRHVIHDSRTMQQMTGRPQTAQQDVQVIVAIQCDKRHDRNGEAL